MFRLHVSKAEKLVIVMIAVLAPLIIIAAIHFLNRSVKSVDDNVLTEQIIPAVM